MPFSKKFVIDVAVNRASQLQIIIYISLVFIAVMFSSSAN